MEVLGRIPASPTQLTAFSNASCTSRPAVLMLQRTRSGEAAGPGPFHTGHRPRWLANSGQLPLLGFRAGCRFLAMFDVHLTVRIRNAQHGRRSSVGRPVPPVGAKHPGNNDSSRDGTSAANNAASAPQGSIVILSSRFHACPVFENAFLVTVYAPSKSSAERNS
jgi:hypothetical protein